MAKFRTNLTTSDISFDTADGVTIKGTLVPSSQLKSAAILMLHQLGRDRATFLPLWEPLHNAGFTLLAIDLRGHGESLKSGEKTLDWENFAPEDWQNMSLDVDGALDVLSKQRGVIADQLGIIGASIGANLALLSLARNTNLKSGVLLSAGLDYRSISLEKIKDKPLEQSVLLIAAQGDNYAFESAKSLYQNFGPDTLYEIEGEAHGTDMLLAEPQLESIINTHFRKTLKAY